jgi:hypothetical protein
MRQARDEFGDDVMLVTSRIASPEFRHLGDYEVVFATDERETAPEPTNLPVAPVSAGFGQIFRQQLGPLKLYPENGAETSIDTIHSSLVDIGLPPALTEALTALIRSSVRPHAEDPARESAPLQPVVAAWSETLISHSLPVLDAWPETLTDHLPDRPAEPSVPPMTTAIVVPEPEPPMPGAALTAVLSAAPPDENVPSGMGEIELTGEICETVILRSIEWKAVSDISRKAFVPARTSRRILRTSRVPAKSGFVIMLIALGLYGVTRQSGS